MPPSGPITRSTTRTGAFSSQNDQHGVSSSDASDDDDESALQEDFEEEDDDDGFSDDQGYRSESETKRQKCMDKGRAESPITISLKKTCKVIHAYYFLKLTPIIPFLYSPKP